MKIKTAYLGEVEINTSQILQFEHGIPGFEDEKQFVLLPIENNDAFHVLQSIQSEHLAFIVTNPYDITANYNFEIDEAIVKTLHIINPNEVAVLSIVSLKETLEQSTINLKAPIVWNTTNYKAKQVILNNDQFEIHHLISTESI